jgi:hypothetical protein
MEFYDSNMEYNAYLQALKQKFRTYLIKVEPLDHWERAICDIVKYVDESNTGQINVNYQQGCQRSCSLSLADLGKEFLPSENSVFWYNKKFKLYLGIQHSDTVFWWSQGVFVISGANAEGNIINIEGVDKFALFDGTTGLSMNDLDTIVLEKKNIRDLISNTIISDMGNGKPIDPILPHIDVFYNNVKTSNKIVLNNGSYMGELFTQLATDYSADVYYDRNGHFTFTNLYTDNRCMGYKLLAPQWHYDFNNSDYCTPNISYDYSGCNSVMVITNSSEFKNVSYTSYNHSPKSPIRVDAVGKRWMPIEELEYVTCSESDMEDICRQHGEYLLMKQAMMGASITFNSPIIPHLDVNQTVSITDENFKLDGDLYIIQSLSIPLGSGEMSVTACNITYLPDTSDLVSRSAKGGS